MKNYTTVKRNELLIHTATQISKTGLLKEGKHMCTCIQIHSPNKIADYLVSLMPLERAKIIYR